MTVMNANDLRYTVIGEYTAMLLGQRPRTDYAAGEAPEGDEQPEQERTDELN